MLKTLFITTVLVASAASLAAQTYPTNSFMVNYFSSDPVLARITSQGLDLGSGAGTKNGTAYPPGNLCAMIYVFAPDQQMSECCGCGLTPNALLTLDGTNLLSNPLTGAALPTGVIKIVSSTGYPACNPSNPVPATGLSAWATHTQTLGITTETPFLNSTLSTGELKDLANTCAIITKEGSGAGVCTCPASI
jgi:hypothetical protein